MGCATQQRLSRNPSRRPVGLWQSRPSVLVREGVGPCLSFICPASVHSSTRCRPVCAIGCPRTISPGSTWRRSSSWTARPEAPTGNFVIPACLESRPARNTHSEQPSLHWHTHRFDHPINASLSRTRLRTRRSTRAASRRPCPENRHPGRAGIESGSRRGLFLAWSSSDGQGS